MFPFLQKTMKPMCSEKGLSTIQAIGLTLIVVLGLGTSVVVIQTAAPGISSVFSGGLQNQTNCFLGNCNQPAGFQGGPGTGSQTNPGTGQVPPRIGSGGGNNPFDSIGQGFDILEILRQIQPPGWLSGGIEILKNARDCFQQGKDYGNVTKCGPTGFLSQVLSAILIGKLLVQLGQWALQALIMPLILALQLFIYGLTGLTLPEWVLGALIILVIVGLYKLADWLLEKTGVKGWLADRLKSVLDWLVPPAY